MRETLALSQPTQLMRCSIFVLQFLISTLRSVCVVVNGCFAYSHDASPRNIYFLADCTATRYSNHIKSMLRKCNIPESNLENLAADRESWRSTCAAGLKNLSAASKQVASDRLAELVDMQLLKQLSRACNPACPQCGRICASDFGLRSHLRSHRRPQN